jgi:hypothetical protein
MIRTVLSSRLMVIVLVALLGAGHALLDSCLLGCRTHAHAAAQESASATPHCHDEGATPGSGARWATTSRCDHDHTELSADVVSQPRTGTASRALTPALAPAAIVLAADGGSRRIDLGHQRQPQPRLAASPTPLRL